MNKSFNIDAPIVLKDEQEIADALREIADAIEDGIDGGDLPGLNQGMMWSVDDDDDWDDENEDEDDDNDDRNDDDENEDDSY